MNDAQPMDMQPLVEAVTRQRNEMADRLAQAEAALFQTQSAFKFEHERAAKLQSMLDDTLVAMKQQQDCHALNSEERDRIEGGLKKEIHKLEKALLERPSESNWAYPEPVGVQPEPDYAYAQAAAPIHSIDA
jgi:septal ring factor EnvC (AmiA/AmiB activator)